MSTLTKHPPFTPAREITTVRNRLRRLFDEPFGFALDLPMNVERQLNAAAWMPAVEVTENPKEYLITAELPGISPENIEVSVVEGILTIKGSKDEEKANEDKERTFHMWEREYGRFERTFRFPLEVLDAKVSAEFSNGLLLIKLPKAERTTPNARMVPVARK